MSNCIFLTGSVTHALKAKRLLAAHSIPVETTKVTAHRGKKGCVYGIEFNRSYKSNIVHLLTNAGIEFEEYEK